MLARHALPWIYRRFAAAMDGDDRLEFAASMGDRAADVELQRRRREAVAGMGGSIA